MGRPPGKPLLLSGLFEAEHRADIVTGAVGRRGRTLGEFVDVMVSGVTDVVAH